MKKLFKKMIVLILTAVLLTLSLQSVQVQAAGMSYSKAMKMYSQARLGWIRNPRLVKITDDLRARSSWFGNDTGKSVYLHKIYCSDMSYWMCKDLNGDGVPEYLTVMPKGQLLILTIYNNKVKVLAVLQTTSVMPGVYYNRKNKTFTIAASITARLTSRNVYKIRNGKLYRLATLSDAVGQMNGYGYVPVNRYLNGKEVSKQEYNSYYQKYCKNMKYVRWFGNQE